MSSQETNPAELLSKLAYLTKDYMPKASWVVGGAFRYDVCLLRMVMSLRKLVGVRQISRVSGAPPCLWSLDWHAQRNPMDEAACIRRLDTYTRLGVGVILEFDNPFISEEELHDPYALFLVRELARRNVAHLHAVSVANDRLAEFLRAQVPSLPIYSHVNRLHAEPESTRRDAAFYNELARRYNRVCLHPADAADPAVYGAIREPARMDVIINDSCLRSCPLRREHLQVLADWRREPYAIKHRVHRQELQKRAGCMSIDAVSLQQKKTGNLTKTESRALYAAGYHNFVIQASQFRNEITLMWDIIHCMFAPTPETSNKIARINGFLLVALNSNPKILSSGMGMFNSFSND